MSKSPEERFEEINAKSYKPREEAAEHETSGRGNGTGATATENIPLWRSSTARWTNIPPPELQWTITGLIPRGMVTLLVAEGGAGKSLLMQSACLVLPVRLPLLGKATLPGATAGFFAEDPEETLHQRHASICAHYKLDQAAIATRCFIKSYFSDDKTLWENGAPTRLMIDLQDGLRTIPDLVLLCVDNAALVYGGKENDRMEVTRFMAALNAMAYKLNIGLLLSTHKSKSDDGSPMRAASGSTAWINASRQVLELLPESGNSGPHLKVIKSNHARRGEEIKLAWSGGVLTHVPVGDLQQRVEDSRIVQAIKDVVRQGFSRGDPYSSSSHSADRFLPAAVVRKESGLKRKVVESAMLTMIDNGVLERFEYKSNRAPGLRVAGDGDMPRKSTMRKTNK
jgi:hypothetical protein